MNRLTIASEALRDVQQIADYIAQRNVGAATRFCDAVFRTYELLEIHSNVGNLRFVRRERLEGVRSFGVMGFRNYRVFFRPDADGDIIVLRVLHGARDIESII